MATIICSTCGTRNPKDADTCRRCGKGVGGSASLSGGARGGGESLLAGRWEVGQRVPGSDNPYLFMGYDRVQDRRVLINRLTRSAALDRTVRGRFSKEAEILGALEHPGIARLEEVIIDGDLPAMILHVTGQVTLSHFLEHQPRVPVGIALESMLQLLDIFDYLHRKRITHRQLMPTKILVGIAPQTGFPRLSIVDFGLAHRVEVMTLDELEFGSGTLMGVRATDSLTGASPLPYQAPEQLAGESHEQSDIYSLGVIFFELLTGDLPLSNNPQDEAGTERSIRMEEPTDVRLLRPEISPELESVIMTMLSKDPACRFQSVRDVRDALVMAPEAKTETMVAVEKGYFTRGSAADEPTGRPEERPQREVYLDAYFIDRTPVTAASYQVYLNATGRKPDTEWHRFNDPKNAPLRPVVYITWQEAADYAHWAGKYLPSEAQWEKAARGTDARAYPWGNEEPNDKRACFDAEQPCEVGAHPFGTSPWGVHEMAGNVFEWVADWYAPDYYARAPERNPSGPQSGSKKVIRGGSFAHGQFALRCASRGRYQPDTHRANHGFRCAWSLDQDALEPDAPESRATLRDTPAPLDDDAPKA